MGKKKSTAAQRKQQALNIVQSLQKEEELGRRILLTGGDLPDEYLSVSSDLTLKREEVPGTLFNAERLKPAPKVITAKNAMYAIGTVAAYVLWVFILDYV